MSNSLLIFAFAVWILSGAPAFAGPVDSSDTPAIITVGNAVLDETGTATIPLLLTPGRWPVAAIQFDVQFQHQVLSLSAALGAPVISAGKSLWTSTPAPGTKSILIAGTNSTAIPAGILATFTIQVPAGVSLNDYPPVIMNATASDGTGFFVALQVTNAGASPAVLAVANAASYETGAVAPGEMVVIWGSSLGSFAVTPTQLDANGLVATSLAGTSVLFDGTPAPLVYTSQNQISAIVPYAVDGRSQTSIQVEYQGVQSAPFIATVVKSSPGLFTLDGSGHGQGAILNQDGTVNGTANPAPRGSIVSVYGTGAGQTVPPCANGSIMNSTELRPTLLSVNGQIGDQNTEVVYAGSTGGQVCSLLQVNLRVPLTVAPSGNVPVKITTTTSSQSGVTMAVQ